MSLVKWNPDTALFSSLSSWMDDFFTGNGDFPQPMIKGISIPAVNVTENKAEFKLEVAVPGFKKEDFNLEVKNGYLLIKGENKAEKEAKEDNYTRREFRFNSFNRSFSLPDNVKESEIKANYKDGILMVTLPKTKLEKAELTQSIPVQ